MPVGTSHVSRSVSQHWLSDVHFSQPLLLGAHLQAARRGRLCAAECGGTQPGGGHSRVRLCWACGGPALHAVVCCFRVRALTLCICLRCTLFRGPGSSLHPTCRPHRSPGTCTAQSVRGARMKSAAPPAASQLVLAGRSGRSLLSALGAPEFPCIARLSDDASADVLALRARHSAALTGHMRHPRAGTWHPGRRRCRSIAP